MTHIEIKSRWISAVGACHSCGSEPGYNIDCVECIAHHDIAALLGEVERLQTVCDAAVAYCEEFPRDKGPHGCPRCHGTEPAFLVECACDKQSAEYRLYGAVERLSEEVQSETSNRELSLTDKDLQDMADAIYGETEFS